VGRTILKGSHHALDGPDADGERRKESVSAAHLRSAGLLVETPFDTADLSEAFVSSVEHINDADASCIALAGVLANSTEDMRANIW
jgi:hypothetical protein